MFKKMFKFIIVALFLLPVYLMAFDGGILCSKATNIQDQWGGILHDRHPLIPTVSNIVRNEPFNVAIFFSNPSIQNGHVNVTGKLVVLDPKGNIKWELQLHPQTFACTVNQSVFLFSDSIKISFDPPDSLGSYTCKAIIKDNIQNKTFTATTAITLGEKNVISTDKDPMKFLNKYYQNQKKQCILPGFKQALIILKDMQTKQGKSFNPVNILALFYFLLKENPQLCPEFVNIVKSQSNLQSKRYGVIILHELGKSAFDLLPNKDKKLWNSKYANLFKVDVVSRPFQLDILWSNFLVTGKKEPIVKIVNEIGKIAAGTSIEEFKKIKKPKQQDKQLLLAHLTGKAALWSLTSNAKQHKLVHDYLEAMLKRNEIKNAFTATAINNFLNKSSKNIK